MFRPGGLKPWHTKVGQSRLEEHVHEIVEGQRKGSIAYTEDKTRILHTEGKDVSSTEEGTLPKVES